MKLTDELKEKIDDYFSEKSPESLYKLYEQYANQRVIEELELFRKWQKDNWKDVYLYSDEFMIREFNKSKLEELKQ